MLKPLKHNWRRLKEGEPGRRFQDRYHRQHANGRRRTAWKRILKIAAGVAICAAGVFFMPAPGPGWVIFVLGAALISDEFLFLARFLDWLEPRLRSLAEWAMGVWRRASLPGKTLICVLALACLAAIVYGGYAWWFGTGWSGTGGG